MAIGYVIITWDIARRTIPQGAWGKELETGRGLRVLIVINGQAATPSTETLKLRYKLDDGTDAEIAGVLADGGYNIELDNLLAAKTGSVKVDLELTVSDKIISSDTFIIPVYTI